MSGPSGAACRARAGECVFFGGLGAFALDAQRKLTSDLFRERVSALSNRTAHTETVEADGLDDLIIGARSADPDSKMRAGESYVVFGRTTGFPAVFELGSLLPP